MKDSVRLKTKRTGNLSPAGFFTACERTVRQTMEIGTQKAEDKAPRRSGRLKGEQGGGAGIRYDVEVEIAAKKIRGIMYATARNPITGEDYSGWVHEGTGVHGPHQTPIKPKRGNFLVFLRDGRPNPTTDSGWKAEHEAGNVVFAREVQGQEPQPFLADGLEEAFTKTRSIFNAEVAKLNQGV